MKYLINKYPIFIFGIAALLLTGCNILKPKIDRTLSPPENGKTVKITVDVPDIAELLPMKIMYRSNLCRKTYNNNEVPTYTVSGFNSEIVLLEKEGHSSLYSAELPYRGGGECDWQLSNATLVLNLKNNETFAKDINHISGSGVIIIFDNNQPQRIGGREINKKGDFEISSQYFPWVNQLYKKSSEKYLLLYGEELFIYYKSRDAKKITWKPIIHTNAVVYSEYPAERKTKGVQRTFYYSDGTQEITNESNPNYQKLLSLIK